MKSNLQQINGFLQNQKIGLVGVSRKKEKFGNQVMEGLLNAGYTVVPVHRELTSINDMTCVASVGALPDDVNALCLVVPKTETDTLLKAALQKGIQNIWIQQMSDGPETEQIALASDANIVRGRCIFMYTRPTGIHKFHERLSKFFGTYGV